MSDHLLQLPFLSLKLGSPSVCRACGRQNNGLPTDIRILLSGTFNTPLPCNVTYSQLLGSQVANHATLKQENFSGLSRWARGNHKDPLVCKRKTEKLSVRMMFSEKDLMEHCWL